MSVEDVLPLLLHGSLPLLLSSAHLAHLVLDAGHDVPRSRSTRLRQPGRDGLRILDNETRQGNVNQNIGIKLLTAHLREGEVAINHKVTMKSQGNIRSFRIS